MRPLRERLARGDTLVGDGAMGTALAARGLPAGLASDAWCLTHAAEVLAVSRAYVAMGAEVVQTNTFGAARMRFESREATAADAITAAAVAIARRAATDDAYVVGVVGPHGGRQAGASDEASASIYAAQAQALVDAGVDALRLETMTEAQEAAVAVRALRRVAGTRVVVCTFHVAGDASAPLDALRAWARAAFEAAAAAGADAVGANCGHGLAGLQRVAPLLAEVTTLPLWLQPSAGLPMQDAAGRWRHPETAAQFASEGLRLLATGRRVLGIAGCCGTTPAHVAALRAARDARSA